MGRATIDSSVRSRSRSLRLGVVAVAAVAWLGSGLIAAPAFADSGNASDHATGVSQAPGQMNKPDSSATTTTTTSTQPQPLSNADQNPGGANNGGDCGAYCSTRDGSASQNGNGNGAAVGKPCAGCVGKADNKNPPGQQPDGTDHNKGYECDANHGIGRTNPAHTGCTTTSTTPPSTCTATKSCGGTTGDCTATHTCGGTTGDCTVTNTCGGTPGNCTATNTCGGTTGDCTVTNTCGGTAGDCTTTNTCGGTAGDCTVTGTCPATTPNCVPSAANNFCSTVLGVHHQRQPTTTPATTTTPPTTVLGEKIVHTPTATVRPGVLPFTGLQLPALGGLIVGLLLLGGLALRLGRRREDGLATLTA